MRPIDPVLVDLARAQSGVFSARQAHEVAVTSHELQAWVRTGSIRRVRQGGYVLAQVVEGVTPETRLALTTRAVLLTRRPRTWASHHAALALAGLPVFGVDVARVDLCADVARSFRRSGVVTHPVPDREPCVIVAGARSVSTETALVQTCATFGLASGLVPLDRALHDGLVTVEHLLERADRLGLSQRRRGLVERMVSAADPAAESPGESRTRLLLISAGEPCRSQVRICDAQGFVGRVDFLVGERVILEFDGLVKYAGLDGKQALAAEKSREKRLTAGGYEVERLVWADLAEPMRVLRKIRAARARLQARGLPSA